MKQVEYMGLLHLDRREDLRLILSPNQFQTAVVDVRNLHCSRPYLCPQAGPVKVDQTGDVVFHWWKALIGGEPHDCGQLAITTLG